tara:strand:- start:8011 stop:8940 length:930 start_codon:yes stop_codon:yes gene_type:complete
VKELKKNTNSKIRSSKVVELKNAVKFIKKGSTIAIGGFAIYQRPMAFIREIIRQKINNLKIIGVTNSIDADILIGTNNLKSIETSYVGFEKYGLAPNFRKYSEKGKIQILDYPELICIDRFRASQENLDFWPAKGLGGTDIVKLNKKIKKFNCPISKKTLHAIPAAKPDVVLIHALAADEFGNIIVPSYKNMAQSLDILLSRCCENNLVTVEKIVSNNFIKKHPNLIEIPNHRVKTISLAPFGAHPTSMLGKYSDDEKHWKKYIKATKNEKSFKQYINKYISLPKNNNDYLNKIGGSHLSSLIQVDVQK